MRLVVNWVNFSLIHFVFPGAVSFFLLSFLRIITLLTPNFLPMILIFLKIFQFNRYMVIAIFLPKKKKKIPSGTFRLRCSNCYPPGISIPHHPRNSLGLSPVSWVLSLPISWFAACFGQVPRLLDFWEKSKRLYIPQNALILFWHGIEFQMDHHFPSE